MALLQPCMCLTICILLAASFAACPPTPPHCARRLRPSVIPLRVQPIPSLPAASNALCSHLPQTVSQCRASGLCPRPGLAPHSLCRAHPLPEALGTDVPLSPGMPAQPWVAHPTWPSFSPSPFLSVHLAPESSNVATHKATWRPKVRTNNQRQAAQGSHARMARQGVVPRGPRGTSMSSQGAQRP